MRSIAAAVVVFAASSCMTLHGSVVRAGRGDAVHRVMVTSTPPDAQVFVDGEHVGATPVRIVVGDGDPGPVITIEKDGYRTYRHRLQRSGSAGRIAASIGIGAGIGILVNGALNARYEGRGFDDRMAVGAVSPVVDWASGALSRFPDRVDARLAWSPEQEREPQRSGPRGPRERPK